MQRALQAFPLERTAHRLNVGEGMEDIRPVQRLPAQNPAQLQQILLSGDVVKLQRRQHVFAAAGTCPAAKGLAFEVAILVFEEFIHERQHALVHGRGEILIQRLQADHQRPVVVVQLRAEPAVLALARQNPLDVIHRAGLQLLVVQSPRERNQTVQIVRRALPAITLATQPRAAVAYVRPDLPKLSGDALCLRLHLRAQPALRADRAQRQGRQGIRRERCFVENGFHFLPPRVCAPPF